LTGYSAAILRQELVADEGNRAKPYRCPAGFLTIGIGHNLDANGLPAYIVDDLFQHDVSWAEADLDRVDPTWREHPDAVQRAMINLVFNMGAAGWAKFKNTRAALARKDYAAAAKGLQASKWARQVQPSRRDRIIAQVRSGAC
jgi:lysozyme